MKGVILAGGQSTRMGQDKASVLVGGRTMIDRVRAALEEAGLEVAVVGREAPAFSDASPDIWQSMGPLSGLATALTEWGSCVLVAVDQPLLRPETVRRLVDSVSELPVVPLAGGARQVTCAAYPGSWAGLTSEEVASRGSIQSLLDRADHVEVAEAQWRSWGEDGRSWLSVDTPEDVALAERILSGDGTALSRKEAE